MCGKDVPGGCAGLLPHSEGKGHVAGIFFCVPKLPPSDSSCFSELGGGFPSQCIPIMLLQFRPGDAKEAEMLTMKRRL